MTRLVILTLLIAGCATGAAAQGGPSLAITVVDPTGAVIVGAQVQVQPDAGVAIDVPTGQNGVARVELPQPGRVSVHVESPGFEPAALDGLRVTRDTRRTVKLKLAKVYETVDVARDPRERASDPRSDAFATILGAAEIQELPDDPDEMERILKELAGPGAVMRVNGFRGGRLPPKDQIAQIRFHRNMFAADAHEPGFISVDIITKPGFENWRGSTGFGLRDDALNARNAFAPEKGDERNVRGAFDVSGPLWQKHTSLALSVNGTNAYDTQTIVATTLEGAFAQSIRRPNDAANVSLRLEHALSASQQLRAEVQRTHKAAENLGVGNFDLPSRAYRQTENEHVVRGSVAGSLGKAIYNEARISWLAHATDSASATHAATTTVLDAFTSGGAQIDGARTSSVFEASDDLDISRGNHAIRTGMLLTSGRYSTAEERNTIGTFTFADLTAYEAIQPTTFTRTTGDPHASVTQTQLATYLQDDYRVSRTLTLSGGVRQEFESTSGGLHLGPRGGITWSPFQSGRTTIRGGAGIFFDWFDANDYLHAVQLDGHHQQIETVLPQSDPSIPDAPLLVYLPDGRIQLAPGLDQPTLRETNVAVEQTFGPVRLNAMVVHRRGTHEFRSIDINAPINGARPDPLAGPVTEVRAAASSGFDGLNINLNIVRPDRRIFVAARYMFSRSFNETDSPFALAADAANLPAERGPALDHARHRVTGFASFPLARMLSAGIAVNLRSPLPYDITTGDDDNGDSLSTDRPAGVTRNTARGGELSDVSARLAWRIGFGGAPTAGPAGPQFRIVRGNDANPLGGMPSGDLGKRYGLEIYVQVFNALNHVNAKTFSGVQRSPYFGQAVEAGAPRRVEIGGTLTF